MGGEGVIYGIFLWLRGSFLVSTIYPVQISLPMARIVVYVTCEVQFSNCLFD